MPPSYNRVERIQRDPQHDSGPDWQHNSDEETEEESQEQFEDDYDPEWSDPAAVEPYGPDGVLHDAATDSENANYSEDSGDSDDGSGPEPGQHIDISA
jgi:hypothetical protein